MPVTILRQIDGRYAIQNPNRLIPSWRYSTREEALHAARYWAEKWGVDVDV